MNMGNRQRTFIVGSVLGGLAAMTLAAWSVKKVVERKRELKDWKQVDDYLEDKLVLSTNGGEALAQR